MFLRVFPSTPALNSTFFKAFMRDLNDSQRIHLTIDHRPVSPGFPWLQLRLKETCLTLEKLPKALKMSRIFHGLHHLFVKYVFLVHPVRAPYTPRKRTAGTRIFRPFGKVKTSTQFYTPSILGFQPLVFGDKNNFWTNPYKSWFTKCQKKNFQKLTCWLTYNKTAGWPLVGNEGINLYIGILGIHSLIPY